MLHKNAIEPPSDPRSGDKVISVREAAEIIGVSPATLKRRAQAGDLAILKLSVRRRGIRRREVARYLDACGQEVRAA